MRSEPGIVASGRTEPYSERRILDPVERISEVLFGLIMALTFTGTLSVVNADKTEIKTMLVGAIGCNIAWGLVDAVMYLVTTMILRGRSLTLLKHVRETSDSEKANEYIKEHLPPVIADVLGVESIDNIRQKLNAMPELPSKKLRAYDFKAALGIFILVVLSTLPPVIPFLFVRDAAMALRISNLVAIIMMFISGWMLARFAGNNKLLTGIVVALLGIGLVLLTILLGG